MNVHAAAEPPAYRSSQEALVNSLTRVLLRPFRFGAYTVQVYRCREFRKGNCEVVFGVDDFGQLDFDIFGKRIVVVGTSRNGRLQPLATFEHGLDETQLHDAKSAARYLLSLRDKGQTMLQLLAEFAGPVTAAAEPAKDLVQVLHEIWKRPATYLTSGSTILTLSKATGTDKPTIQVRINDRSAGPNLRYLYKLIQFEHNVIRIADLGDRFGFDISASSTTLPKLMAVFVQEYKNFVMGWDHAQNLRTAIEKAADTNTTIDGVQFFRDQTGALINRLEARARIVGNDKDYLSFAFSKDDRHRALLTYIGPGRSAWHQLTLEQVQLLPDLAAVATWVKKNVPQHFHSAQAAAEPESTKDYTDPAEFEAAAEKLKGTLFPLGGLYVRIDFERRSILGSAHPTLLVRADTGTLSFTLYSGLTLDIRAATPSAFLFRTDDSSSVLATAKTPKDLLRVLLGIRYRNVTVAQYFVNRLRGVVATSAAEPKQDPRIVLCDKLLSRYGVHLNPAKITYMGKDGIDYAEGVFWDNKNLTKIPIRFRNVRGSFSVSMNRMTSLENSPVYVHGNFSCSWNRIISLKYAPVFVGEDFSCSANMLTSLEHAPAHVGANFACSDNRLPPTTKKPSGVVGNLVLGIQQRAQAAAEPEQSPELVHIREQLERIRDQELVQENGVSAKLHSAAFFNQGHALAVVVGLVRPDHSGISGTTPYHIRVAAGKYTVSESNGNILGSVAAAVGLRGILSILASHTRKHLQTVYRTNAAAEHPVDAAPGFVRDLIRLAQQVGYIEIEDEPVPLKVPDTVRPGAYDAVLVGDVYVDIDVRGHVKMLSRGHEEELTGSTTAELASKLSKFVLKHTESLTSPFRKLAKQLGNKTIKLTVAGVRIRIHYSEPYIIAESDKHKLVVYSIPKKVVVRSGGYPGQIIPAPSTKELALNLAKAVLDLEHGVERGR